MYLIDTNVLSLSAPGRRTPFEDLQAWLRCHNELLYLSAMSVAEVESGIFKATRQQEALRSGRLRSWLDNVVDLFAARILPLDVSVARVLGVLIDGCRASGSTPSFADLVIAATAKAHDYTLLSRNIRHFQILPVRVVNPFESLPPRDAIPS